MGSSFLGWFEARILSSTNRGVRDMIDLFSLDLLRKRSYFMKRIEEKFRRIVKYWCISYKQASVRDRLSIGMFLLLLAYEWWLLLVF